MSTQTDPTNPTKPSNPTNPTYTPTEEKLLAPILKLQQELINTVHQPDYQPSEVIEDRLDEYFQQEKECYDQIKQTNNTYWLDALRQEGSKCDIGDAKVSLDIITMNRVLSEYNDQADNDSVISLANLSQSVNYHKALEVDRVTHLPRSISLNIELEKLYDQRQFPTLQEYINNNLRRLENDTPAEICRKRRLFRSLSYHKTIINLKSLYINGKKVTQQNLSSRDLPYLKNLAFQIIELHQKYNIIILLDTDMYLQLTLNAMMYELYIFNALRSPRPNAIYQFINSKVAENDLLLYSLVPIGDTISKISKEIEGEYYQNGTPKIVNIRQVSEMSFVLAVMRSKQADSFIIEKIIPRATGILIEPTLWYPDRDIQELKLITPEDLNRYRQQLSLEPSNLFVTAEAQEKIIFALPANMSYDLVHPVQLFIPLPFDQQNSEPHRYPPTNNPPTLRREDNTAALKHVNSLNWKPISSSQKLISNKKQ